MPLWKYAGLLFLAGVFDVLKAGCVLIIFIAPIAVGAAANYVTYSYLEDKIGSTLAAPIAAIVGIGAGGLIATTPIDEMLEGLGIFLAMLFGIMGWIFFGLVLTVSGGFSPQARGGRHIFIFLGGFMASVAPVVDALPTFIPAIWGIARDIRKADAAARAKWEGERQAFEAAVAQAQQERAQAAYASLVREEQPAEAEFEAIEPEVERRKSPPLIAAPAYGF